MEGNWLSRYQFYRNPQVIGSPRDPFVFSANRNPSNETTVIDWISRDRVEIISDGVDDNPSPKYSLYMADRITWIGAPSEPVSEIAAYDLVILRSDMAMRSISSADTRHLTLQLQHDYVAQHIPSPGRLCGRRLSIDSGHRDVARSIMFALRFSLANDLFETVSSQLFAVLFKSINEIEGEHQEIPILADDRRVEYVQRLIRRYYADGEFSAATIAQMMNISPRYLYMICAEHAPPAEMIRDYRLKLAAERLRDPAWQNCAITDIAFACGFNSSSHFATIFKHRYGISPREYRRERFLAAFPLAANQPPSLVP